MKIGFIGLGNMGFGMAHNIQAKGFDLTVYDNRPEPVAKLVDEGAGSAATVEELGSLIDIVSIAVFDDVQLAEVVMGNATSGGLLARMKPGGIILLHPTVPPSVVKRMADAARDRQIDVLDVPMTGGANVAAMAGTLTFMVGGDAAILERARPVLNAMATSIFHLGPLGAGMAAKIINNYLAISHLLAAREAVRLAKAVGIAESTIFDIVNRGHVGSNWATNHWEQLKDQERNYTTGPAGIVAMSTKDLQLAGRMASEMQVNTPALNSLVANALPDIALSGVTDSGL